MNCNKYFGLVFNCILCNKLKVIDGVICWKNETHLMQRSTMIPMPYCIMAMLSAENQRAIQNVSKRRMFNFVVIRFVSVYVWMWISLILNLIQASWYGFLFKLEDTFDSMSFFMLNISTVSRMACLFVNNILFPNQSESIKVEIEFCFGICKPRFVHLKANILGNYNGYLSFTNKMDVLPQYITKYFTCNFDHWIRPIQRAEFLQASLAP